jgi:hypothetical protein
MQDLSVILPFKVPNLFAGFAEGRGMAKASPSELTLEFVVKETVLSVFKSGVRELRIPQAEIDMIRHQQGWFRDTVCIRVRSMKWLEDLPGSDKGEVKLRVARRDRALAVDFVQVLGRSGLQK